MATVVLVAVLGMGIISGITYGTYSEQTIHEINGATRLAGEILEGQRRRLFHSLESFSLTPEEARERGFIIYDNGTPNHAADDTIGSVELRFFTTDGVEVGDGAAPIPLDLSMLRAEVTVRWNPAGRGNARERTVRMSTLVAP